MEPNKQRPFTTGASAANGETFPISMQNQQRVASQQVEDRDEDLIFTLPSGRNLGYARYGPPTSKYPPTIYLHGYPASRIEASLLVKDLHAAGLQLIALDRPGTGLSSPDPNRTIMDHARDVLALADHLGLEKFAVVGVSGGGPYAFACTQVVPAERLVGTGILSGMGPYEMVLDKEIWKELWWLNKVGFIGPVRFPRIYSFIYPRLFNWILGGIERMSYDKMLASRDFNKLDRADREVVVRGGEQGYKDIIRCVQEAKRQEQWARWHLQDARLLGQKWEFELEDVKSEVRLWYGEKDRSTPAVYGRKIADKLPAGRLTVLDDGTHASVVYDAVKWIKELVAFDSAEPSRLSRREDAR